jgi:phytoene/squalene synthetase
MRLQWWADALDEIAAGGIVRRHEVVTPLAHVLDAAGARCLKDAVEARRSDAHGIAVDTFETLEAYLAATGGALHWAAARALGSTDETRARRVGGAIARANWLRAVPGLLRRGARPLPDPTARGLAAAARRWRAALSDSPGADGKAGVGQRHADLAAWRVRRTLKVAARHPDRVLAGALTEPGVGERAVLAAAAAGLRGLP